MKKILLASLSFLLIPCLSWALSSSGVKNLIQKSKIPESRLGIKISVAGEGKTLYALNETKAFIPASLTKIVTAAAALERFPVGHQFETEILSTSSESNGALDGPIYFKGGGDAAFVSESMWFLVNEFSRTGVKRIKGDIIVDDSFFDDVRFDSGRDSNRVDRAYDAPIGALTFNWSSVNIYVRPGDKAGEPARVIVDPPNDYIKMVNRTRTGKAGSGNKISVRRNPIRGQQGDEIVVQGTLAEGHREIVIYRSISEPDLWAAYNLKEFLSQRGIAVDGEIRRGKTPGGARVLATNKSKPIAQHVTDMMKFSNNYVAEILTKNLSAQAGRSPASMDHGIEILDNYLKSMGLEDFKITSPSGLSRKNQLTPSDIHKVLSHVKKDFRLFPEFLSSFPVGGVDGTLRRRLSSASNGGGQVRAKTGHLTGVAALAGYVGRADEREVIFSFIYNGTANEGHRAQALFDSLVLELLR